MIKRSMMFILMSVFAGLVLSACTSTQETAVTPEATTPPTTEETQTPEEPIETVEVDISRLFVAPQKVECTGEGPQECLLVKENPEDEWQNFYNEIIGFDYEEGYDYEIEVAIAPIENPPAGGSSLEYTLLRILNKQQSPEFPPEAEEVTWIVGPELAECVGVGPQTCLQIKENPEDAWQLFYDNIAGFDYEEGNEYVIRVLVEPVENPPADASSLSYTLIEVVDQQPVEASGMEIDTAVSGEATFEDTLWSLTTLTTPDGNSGPLFPESKITIQFVAREFNGNAGCNGYFGSYEDKGNSLTMGPTASTQKLCLPEEINAQESAYLAQFDNIAQYSIAGQQLSLLDAEGKAILIYEATEPATLSNTLWEVTFYNNGRGGAVSVVGGTQITAQFGEDGSLGGSAGCNSYNTNYETDGDSITINELIATTMMFCETPEGVAEQETEYLAALPTAATYNIQEDALELRTAEGSLVASYAAVKAPTLSGSAWDVVNYNNGNQAVVSVIIGSSLTAVFQEDGILTGNAGCNSYSASYELDGDNISIGTTVTTRMFCEQPEGVMDQEAQYLAALQTAVTYSIDGQRMEMRTAEGSKVAGFVIQGYVPPEIQSALDNATYSSEFTESGSVTLVNGEFSEPIVEGSATQLRIQNIEFTAIGANTDGESIIATVLVSDPGGSGTFYSLHVMQYQDSNLVEIAATSLGDRVQINSINIVNGAVVIDMVTHGEEDPLCCPTQQVINTYQIQEGELILNDSQIIENE